MEHQFSKPWENSDVVLQVGEEMFHVHSWIIGLASPVFKAMLNPNFKEGREKVVELPGKDSGVFLNMLKLIYPGTDFELTDESMCVSLLPLVREYDMKGLTKLIDDFLFMDADCSFDILCVADEYLLNRTLKKHVNHFLKMNNFNGDWKRLSGETKLKLLCLKVREVNVNSNCECCQSACSSDKVLGLAYRKLKTIRKMIEVFHLDV